MTFCISRENSSLSSFEKNSEPLAKKAVACPKLLHMHKKDQIFHSVNSKKLK